MRPCQLKTGKVMERSKEAPGTTSHNQTGEVVMEISSLCCNCCSLITEHLNSILSSPADGEASSAGNRDLAEKSWTSSVTSVVWNLFFLFCGDCLNLMLIWTHLCRFLPTSCHTLRWVVIVSCQLRPSVSADQCVPAAEAFMWFPLFGSLSLIGHRINFTFCEASLLGFIPYRCVCLCELCWRFCFICPVYTSVQCVCVCVW